MVFKELKGSDVLMKILSLTKYLRVGHCMRLLDRMCHHVQKILSAVEVANEFTIGNTYG